MKMGINIEREKVLSRENCIKAGLENKINTDTAPQYYKTGIK